LYDKIPEVNLMSRWRRQEEHENNERWLVSYADFITLLLALFVVMYAISQVNEGKTQVLANSLISAFGNQSTHRNFITAVPDPLPRKREPKRDPKHDSERDAKPDSRPDPAGDYLAIKKARDFAEAQREGQRQQQEEMEAVARDIMAAFTPFASLIESGQVRVVQSNLGLGVEINARVLFAPGQAVLQENSSRILEAVAEVLKDSNHAIQVEGHTDNIPIVTEKFPSNWELSAVRASSVVRLLVGSGLDAARLTALGYGENRPVDSNDTEEGRSRNRRVTVLILSAPLDVPPANSPESLRDAKPDTKRPDTNHESPVKVSGLLIT
jgi:chemotaxis protein MotB